MPSLFIYVFSLLVCLLSLVRAGKIGAFRFRNFKNGAFEAYDPLARRFDNTYIGKLTYSGGSRQSIQSPRTAKLENILNRLPYSDRAIPDGEYVVHMVVRQQQATREDIDESDLNSANHSSGAASLSKHVKKSTCTDDATHEVLEFEISQHTNNHLSMPDLLDSECVSLTYKDRKSWTQNPYTLIEKTTAENCLNGEYQDAHLYRDLQATFTAPQETRTVRLPADECIESGDEEIVSFTPETAPETFTEAYVLEEECTDNADAVATVYEFNAGDRWVKSNRGDAITLATELTINTTAALPFFKNLTVSSSTTMTTSSGSDDYAVGQEIERKSSFTGERNTKEPPFTVTAWVKGFGTILSMSSAAMPEACGRKSVFSVNSAGKLKNDWGCSDTHASSLTTTTTEWTHVAFRYDGYGTRSIVVGNQVQNDVSHDTSKDYFAETGSLLSPTTHNAVIVRYNELGDVIGNYEGYSIRQCFQKTLAENHIYFEVSNGVCRSSATKGSGSSAIYRRTIQYMITEVDFSGKVRHGPFSGHVDEVLVFGKFLHLDTIQEVAAHMSIQGRFDEGSRIDHALTGMGRGTKKFWTRYPDFTEDQKVRSDCYDSGDERYSKSLTHPTYGYSGEGRGYAVRLNYTAYSGQLENVSSITLPVQNSLRLCNQEHFDTKLVLHSYQETTHDECMAQQVDDGVCLEGDSMVASTRAECAGVFFPSRAYTWRPDDPDLSYDVPEDHCTVGGDSWGQTQALLFGEQGLNLQVFSDHEMTFYWKNKVGGDSYAVNRSDFESMKEWCRGTISCAGLQLDGDLIYPVEKTLSPQNDSAYGFRLCDERLRKPVETAMQCFMHAAEESGPEGLVYVKGDEFKSFDWGYQGSDDGTACYLDNSVFKWTATASGQRLCSDEPSDYEFLPFEQSRWQRDNDSITSTREDDCGIHKLDWKAHNRVYETVGTSSRPHFVLKGQKSWQREPVDCLYATDATFAINKSTARECRDEAIFWGATGYSFQDVGAEFLYLTPRHFTHVEEAREECKRLHAHRDGPENIWDLCTNAQYDCAADDSCITSNTPDDTIFAKAACCFNTGTSCSITTDTRTCTPKNGYESFSFKACDDEVIENTTNTTYHIYDPVWARPEWRDETRSREYDQAYYDIVEQATGCDRRAHLSYEECLTEKAKAAYAGLTWLGQVYEKEKIAGCAVEGTEIYYNAYRYDSAKQPETGEKAICRRHFEHFMETFDYSNTNCRYLNHELEVSKASLLECQNYADQTGYIAFSFSGTRCLLAKDRGPCEADEAWYSRFFVSPESVEEFGKNPNHEYSILPILECAQNTTAESRIVQVSWGPEAYGVAWKLPVNATTYSSEAEAKAACLDDCPAIYTDGTNYYALDRLEAADEIPPTDASYAQHKHRLRNVENFQNKKLATHFLSNSKEECHAQCLLETTCRMVQFAYGQCIFYNEIYETLLTDKDSFVVYQEIKGAVSYGPSGDCWLYKNYVGQRFSDSISDGDCSEILTTGTGYKTFPVEARLAGENKIVYLLTEPDLTQATEANSITHEQRSQQWCDDRDGQGTWTAYPDVIHEKEEDACAGTWTRNANIVRNNILQRECELPDSKSISWTRNADAVTETKGKGGYAVHYQNGYALRLGKTCDTLDLEISATVYGHACLNKTECSMADEGHGYALIDGECYSYLHEAGGNSSDCRWERTLLNATSHLPVIRNNLADAIEACNARDTCEGICERKEASGRAFVLAKASKASEPSCHAGWSGEDCTTLSPSYNTDVSITDKRHTAVEYCDRIGQRLCPKQTPFPVGNLLLQIAPQSACVHYDASSECSVEDYSSIEAVASCCGRTEKSGKVLLEALYYERIKEPGACSYAKELAGSMVIDGTPKLTDTYTVQQIAKAICIGGTVTVGDCEAACLADSTCMYFSNSSTECKLHTQCTGFLKHFDASAGAFRLRRKQGRYDTPQNLHEVIGDCKYHYTVRDPNVIDQAPYAEASDELVSWRCERATVPTDRRLSLLRHSLNESFKFDVMEDHYINDTQTIELTYKELDYSDSTEDTLQDCLNKNEGKVNAYDENTKRCRSFHDSPYAIPTEALFLGQSYRSAGLFEEFQIATDDTFTVLDTMQPILTVSDWSLSSAQDECEVFCLENDCEAYLMSGQDCKLLEMPNSTTVEYLRAMEPTGNVIVRLKTPSELVCRSNASSWHVSAFETASMPPLAVSALLGSAATLRECKQLFLNDLRTPRLNTLLYNSSTKECRISLLRDSLVAAEGPSTAVGFSAYRIASSAENPYRLEATRYETEDIARETCLPTAELYAGRDCTSIECAAFWFREEDVIRHEVTEDQCDPRLPPELPLLSFAWDRNRQGTLTFNVAEETCRDSQKFISWRTGTEGTGKIVVESEAECLNKTTDEVVAVYLGNEPLPDHRSACNGIVDEHSFEKIFPHPIQMVNAESTRIVSAQLSIDECAAHANAYYAHQNRSTESKVFEYNFIDAQCAIFSEIECPTLCIPDESSSSKQGFSAFRLHGETGLTAASCWLLSVLDSRATGRTNCRKCPLGKHSARAGSNCLPCQQGRYADETGLRACKSCPEGKFQFGSGETHCHNCPAGSYQDIGEGKRNCKLCAAGKYEKDNSCHDCPAGKAAPNNFPENSAGELVYTGANYKGPLMYYDPRFDYSDVHGISYKESDGSYTNGYSPIFTALRKLQMQQHDSPDDCVSCVAGSYSNETGAIECTACAAGQFSDQENATSCKTCSIGEVARPSEASFHELMPFACYSAEELGEYKSYDQNTDAYQKTGEDIGLLREEAQGHVEDCFQSCKSTSECLFVSYKTGTCRLHRKCDEKGETGWTAYRLSKATSSMSDSTSYAVSLEATVFGPMHHECEEDSLLIAPETYNRKADEGKDFGITNAGTIGTALTFQGAIDQCNLRRDCIGFTYSGGADVSLRVFSETNPILLKSQGETFEQTGLQAWFKEQPVDTKEDCQNQCAQLSECSYMEWNGTKACRKWSSCTPKKKASLTATESSLYRIGSAASFAIFPFQGRWPCDAVVFSNKTKDECEKEAVAKTAPMFYYEDDGSCHVYVSYTSNGIDDIYSGLSTRQSSICLSGNAPPAFDDSAQGHIFLIGKRVWDEGATQCSLCPAGLHTEVESATQCRQCQVGTYDKNPQSSNPCEVCELGRFQNEPGQATCKACSAGRYADERGSETCKASGQGYRAVDQGFTISRDLQEKSSGPLQNNTYENGVNLLLQGATGREICGRNSFAAGYENIYCTNVPVGSVSVLRERIWNKETTACIYDNSSVTRYVKLRTDLNFFEGDLYNRNGLHSLDDCIDLANEQSSIAAVDIVGISYENDFCHFYFPTSDGLVPTCLPSLEHASASLTVSEASYGSDSDNPPIDRDWFREWTPHESVRMLSPFECKGLRYEYIGDYFSATDCINLCRMQEKIGKPTCRYISYSSVDFKCYFVNWKADLNKDPNDDLFKGDVADNSIFESTVASIEIPCSFGSRSIARSTSTGACTAEDSSGCGLGGYRYQDFFPYQIPTTYEYAGSGRCNGGLLHMYGWEQRPYITTALYYISIEECFNHCAGLAYEYFYYSYDMYEWWVQGNHWVVCGCNSDDINTCSKADEDSNWLPGTYEWRHWVVGNLNTYKIVGDINYPELKPDTEYSFEETTSGHIGQIMDIKGMRDRDSDSWTDTGLGPTHILSSGYQSYPDVASQQDCFDTCLENGYQFSSFATNSVKCRCANSASSAHAYADGMGVYQYQSFSTGNGGYYKIGSEWAIDSNCNQYTSNNLPSTFSDFGDDCRYKRKRFYDRIKAVLLQEHNIESNMFPDFLLADGYSGDNLLNNLGFYDFKDYQSTDGLKMTYRVKNHIKYDSDSIRPLFDVSTNDDHFHSIDDSSGAFRAKKGANSYEYCSGSTTQRYAVNSPSSCEEVGFPFVANLELSTGSFLRVCTKMKLDNDQLTPTNVHCCIGINCPTDDPTMPLCSAFSTGNYLDTLPYNNPVGLYVDGDETAHTVPYAGVGMAYVKDKCNQLGDDCLGVSQQGDTFRTHGLEATLTTNNQFAPLQMKTVNFIPQGFLFTGGLQASQGIDNIFGCYLVCTRARFCKNFFFNISSRQCYVQNRFDLPSAFETTDTFMFSLRLNKDDTSKAQFCTTCAIGRTASSAVNGAVGVCSECNAGEISSTDDIFVADVQTGKRGQESCRRCPAGMIFVVAMASCLECPKGFACASEGSIADSTTQCKEHEYSTSSLLEFVGEDVSAKASLRCEACPGGKYNAEKSGEYCIKCPNGFFSKSKGYCEPCPRGTYTLQSGSDQCFAIDGSSFISWPASTFSMKQSCATEDCGEAGSRVCTATEDAFCQQCTDIRPGHRTWYSQPCSGTTAEQCCNTEPCPPGTYSTNGCEGEDCCQACVSTCQAGQHSSGCGDPVNDNGGSTQNTQCVDCPVNTFTEVPANIELNFTNIGSAQSCGKDLNEPHLWNDKWGQNSWSRKTTINDQSNRMHGNSYKDKLEQPPDASRPTTEAEFLELYGSAADVTSTQINEGTLSCSARAYQCVPCRTVPKKTTYGSGTYTTISFYAKDDFGTEIGKKDQPAWSTAGKTGQTHCQSWWNEWGSSKMDSFIMHADDYPPPSPSDVIEDGLEEFEDSCGLWCDLFRI